MLQYICQTLFLVINREIIDVTIIIDYNFWTELPFTKKTRETITIPIHLLSISTPRPPFFPAPPPHHHLKLASNFPTTNQHNSHLAGHQQHNGHNHNPSLPTAARPTLPPEPPSPAPPSLQSHNPPCLLIAQRPPCETIRPRETNTLQPPLASSAQTASTARIPRSVTERARERGAEEETVPAYDATRRHVFALVPDEPEYPRMDHNRAYPPKPIISSESGNPMTN